MKIEFKTKNQQKICTLFPIWEYYYCQMVIKRIKMNIKLVNKFIKCINIVFKKILSRIYPIIMPPTHKRKKWKIEKSSKLILKIKNLGIV